MLLNEMEDCNCLSATWSSLLELDFISFVYHPYQNGEIIVA